MRIAALVAFVAGVCVLQSQAELPSPGTVGVAARYAEAGIVLRRTDHAGALQWRMRPDGGTRHSAWRTEGVRYWHNRPGPRAQTDPEADDEPTDPVPVEPFIAG